jgi:hypothetical protein
MRYDLRGTVASACDRQVTHSGLRRALSVARRSAPVSLGTGDCCNVEAIRPASFSLRSVLLIATVVSFTGCGRVGYAAIATADGDGGGDAGPDLFDAELLDAELLDAEVADAEAIDGEAIDARIADASPVDASTLDASTLDAPRGDAGLDVPCGTTVVYRDDFEDSLVDPEWIIDADTGLTVTEELGQMRVVFATAIASGRWGGYTSVVPRDLTTTCVTVEVSRIATQTTDADTYMKIFAGTRTVEMTSRLGMLTARLWEGSTIADLATIPYDAGMHRFWRIHDAGDSIRWEVGPDGVAFTEIARTTELISLAGAATALASGSFRAVTGGGEAHFDSFEITSR